MKIFVDTSAWIAFFDGDDEFHLKAKRFFETEPELVTSDAVFHECIAHLENRISKEVAKKAAEVMLSNKISLVLFLTLEQELSALERYKKTPRGFSFVDCTNLVFIKELGIEQIFAFDRDFGKLGLKVVP